MVNGQTGKVTGKTPISFWKVFFTVLVIVVALLIVLGCGGLLGFFQDFFN